jgi:hypothetical protein
MTKRIGEFLMDRGILDSKQVQEILEYSKKTGLKFGEAGLKLQILAPERLIELFGPGYRTDFFFVTPERFPEETRTVIPPELILSAGALPLGWTEERKLLRTRKLLNLGMLNPQRGEAIRAVEAWLSQLQPELKVAGVRPFLILPDQFLEILVSKYQMTEATIRDRGAAALDPLLCQFLELPPAKSRF